MENPLHEKKVVVYRSEEEDIMKINFKRFLHSVATREYNKVAQMKKKKKEQRVEEQVEQPVDGKVLQVFEQLIFYKKHKIDT